MQTGGTEFGAISTRSSPASCAMARAALISVTPLLAPSLSMSWTSRTRISSLMRGPSLAAGCAVLIGRRMVLVSYVVATGRWHPARTTMEVSAMLFGEREDWEFSSVKSTTMRRRDPLLRAVLRRNMTAALRADPRPRRRPRMNDNSLKFLEIGAGSERRAHCGARAARAPAPGLFWLSGYKSDMKGTKAAALARLGGASRPRLRPLRLFRPRRIGRRLHRGHDRPLARRCARACSMPAAAGRRF